MPAPALSSSARARSPWRIAGLLGLIAALAGGCGFGALQTARPTPRGALDVTLGWGVVYNETVARRAKEGGSGLGFANFPIEANFRYGLTHRVDLGLKLFYVAGVLLDTKVNLLSPENRWALSLRAGFGGAKDLVQREDAGFVHLPVILSASYDLRCGLTPYVALGYELYWIFGRDKADTPAVDYVERKGYGDHLLTATAGLQYRFNRYVALLLEYTFWQPVVDDPGDFFSFVQNHVVLLGVSFRIPFRSFRNPHRPSPSPMTTPGPVENEAPPPPPPPPPRRAPDATAPDPTNPDRASLRAS